MIADPERETILVYPSDEAEPLESLPGGDAASKPYNIVVLDGTWMQAKMIYSTNTMISALRCIKLNNTQRSHYVIRTQPTDTCLSTVEAVAAVLAHLEHNTTIIEALTKPLKAICDFQLENGATAHQSKEFLITNGLYHKPLNKRVKKSLSLQQPIGFNDLLI